MSKADWFVIVVVFILMGIFAYACKPSADVNQNQGGIEVVKEASGGGQGD
jgi:hypothetical protein